MKKGDLNKIEDKHIVKKYGSESIHPAFQLMLTEIRKIREKRQIYRILDAGCANGCLINPIAKEITDIQYIGIDISKTAINEAVVLSENENIGYVRGDLSKCLPFKNELFDIVCSFDIIEHLNSYESYLCEINRVLRNDGFLYLHTPNDYMTKLRKKITKWDGWDDMHVKEFRYGELKRILIKIGFKKISLINFDYPWFLSESSIFQKNVIFRAPFYFLIKYWLKNLVGGFTVKAIKRETE